MVLLQRYFQGESGLHKSKCQNVWQGDSKEIWENVSLLLSKSNAHGKINLLNKETGYTVETEITDELINEYFTNIGSKAKTFHTQWTYDGLIFADNIEDFQTNREEIAKQCKDISIDQSSALEHLSRIIKDAFLAIPDVITTLMNMSLPQGVFPQI